MLKFLMMLLIFVLILSGCHGCSFIQEKFGNKQEHSNQQEENQERQSEPIPTNPQHS